MKLNITPKQVVKLQNMARNFRSKNIDILMRATMGKCPNKYSFVSLGEIVNNIKYSEYIINGQYYKARNLHGDMDTSSRDSIPLYLFETIEYKLE